MNPKIFEWFGKWFEENKDLLKQKELKLGFSEKKVEEVIYAQWVDIISANKLGNVIVYSVGTCDTHTLSLDTAEHLGASGDFINSKDELDKLLKDYIQTL